jgi:hypothetical protein
MARENGRIVVIFAKDNQEAVVLNPILLKILGDFLLFRTFAAL